MKDESNRVPQLARGCRVQSRGENETVLLVPEGLLRLKGAGAEIVALVDGVRTAAEIVKVLQSQYPPEAHAQISTETTSFLESLHQRSVLFFKEP